MRAQQGLAALELGIVLIYAVTVLLACMEIGRAMFVWNTIGEATRRAARLATVTSVNSSSITDAIVTTYGSHLPNLTATNVVVEYLDTAGAATVAPASIAFVRVSITGYTFPLSIPEIVPGLDVNVTVPPFTTTLPVESLGYAGV
jgi:Flp pilus assembly protein TadG